MNTQESKNARDLQLIKELENLIDIGEAVLMEAPEYGGDIFKSVKDITLLTDLSPVVKEELIKKAQQTSDSYDEDGYRIATDEDELD